MSISEKTVGQTKRKPVVCKWIRDASTIRFFKFPEIIYCFDCSPDGSTIVVGQGQYINLYDLNSLQQIGVTMDGNSYSFEMVKYSPQGNRIASANVVALMLWDSKTQQQLYTFTVENLTTLQFTSCGKRILWSNGNELSTLCCQTGKVVCEMVFDYKLITLINSIDDKQVLFANAEKILIWELNRSRIVKKLRANSDYDIHKLECTFNGHLIVSKHKDDLMRIWGHKNGKLIRKFSAEDIDNPDEYHQEQLCASPISNQIITTVNSNQARLWDINTAKYREINQPHSVNLMKNLKFSYDGRLIIFVANYATNKIGIMRLFHAQFMRADNK